MCELYIPRRGDELAHRHGSFVWCMTRKPLHGNGQGAQKRDTRESNCDREGGLETDHVRLKDSRKHVWREHSV